ncbi:MAG: hypothetical protein CMJ19_16525 [Phycisphaeraceae bacterium]|nr:hypothetical protein [Phycisphaeraceae bacterium]
MPLRADDPPANAGGAAGAVTPENNTDQGETDSAAEATQVSDAPEPVNIATDDQMENARKLHYTYEQKEKASAEAEKRQKENTRRIKSLVDGVNYVTQAMNNNRDGTDTASQSEQLHQAAFNLVAIPNLIEPVPGVEGNYHVKLTIEDQDLDLKNITDNTIKAQLKREHMLLKNALQAIDITLDTQQQLTLKLKGELIMEISEPFLNLQQWQGPRKLKFKVTRTFQPQIESIDFYAVSGGRLAKVDTLLQDVPHVALVTFNRPPRQLQGRIHMRAGGQILTMQAARLRENPRQYVTQTFLPSQTNHSQADDAGLPVPANLNNSQTAPTNEQSGGAS